MSQEKNKGGRPKIAPVVERMTTTLPAQVYDVLERAASSRGIPLATHARTILVAAAKTSIPPRKP